MFFAGHSTVSSATCSLLSLVSQSPDARAAVAAEVASWPPEERRRGAPLSYKCARRRARFCYPLSSALTRSIRSPAVSPNPTSDPVRPCPRQAPRGQRGPHRGDLRGAAGGAQRLRRVPPGGPGCAGGRGAGGGPAPPRGRVRRVQRGAPVRASFPPREECRPSAPPPEPQPRGSHDSAASGGKTGLSWRPPYPTLLVPRPRSGLTRPPTRSPPPTARSASWRRSRALRAPPAAVARRRRRRSRRCSAPARTSASERTTPSCCSRRARGHSRRAAAAAHTCQHIHINKTSTKHHRALVTQVMLVLFERDFELELAPGADHAPRWSNGSGSVPRSGLLAAVRAKGD